MAWSSRRVFATLRVKMHKHESAFTLIELMIAIAVAAVVLTLGVPGFGRIIENNQLATNTNVLVSSFTLARSEAIKRNTQVKICDSSDGVNCGIGDYSAGWIVFVDADENDVWDNNADEDLIQVYSALPTNFSLDSNGFTNLSYEPNGRSNASGNFILCKNNDITKARVIIINTTGRTRLTDITTNGVPEDAGGTPIAAC